MSNQKIKSVSILGCGWLGFPLGKELVKNGYKVRGSNTSPSKSEQLKAAGIEPFVLKLDEQEINSECLPFFKSDLLIIAVPPSATGQSVESYANHMHKISQQIKAQNLTKVIFISSTSVYPEHNEIVTEQSNVDRKSSRSKRILLAEEVLKNNEEYALTILRCGGLMGADRVPGKYFAGKKDLDSGSFPVNYVHLDDVIGVIFYIIDKDIWNETLNVVAPLHPTRREVYKQNANRIGFEQPQFIDNPSPNFKIVSSEKLTKHWGFKFKYPDPLHFRYQVL